MAIKWIDMAFIFVDVGICKSEKDYNDWIKKEKITGARPWLDKGANGCCTHFENDGRSLYIISIDTKSTYNNIAALLAHESVHLLQNIREDIRERTDNRMGEYDAYLVQYIMYEALQFLLPNKRKGK